MSKLIKSMSYAVVAQGVSLLVSIFMSFFVSRYMSIDGYGYYQLFLFYSTYVGLFQFGVSEGVYLENGGKKFSQLESPKLKQLFFNTFFVELIVLAVACSILGSLTSDNNKKYVILLIALYSVTYLFVMYFGMLLQAVNLTEKYSRSIIVGKLTTLLLFFGLVIMKNYDYYWYCIVFLAGYVLSGVIVTYDCRDILKERIKPEFILFKNKKIIIAGSSLLLSGLISSFIIGINRIYIEQFLGIEIFAKVSMALSLCNFVILFAIQVGMVMFPSVVVLQEDVKARLYEKLNDYTGLIAPVVFLGYVPLRIILSLWIPQYTDSIRWMLLFVPYMVYEIKTQVMYNTYIKALRKEKLLFLVNLAALIACGLLNYVIIKITKDVVLLFWVVDIVMIIKSFYLSKRIEKEYNLNMSVKLIAEAMCCCAASYLVYSHYGIGTTIIATAVYLLYFLIITRKTPKGV